MWKLILFFFIGLAMFIGGIILSIQGYKEKSQDNNKDNNQSKFYIGITLLIIGGIITGYLPAYIYNTKQNRDIANLYSGILVPM
jgi:uncharacterized membrane protein HdeD (DUF308 family)